MITVQNSNIALEISCNWINDQIVRVLPQLCLRLLISKQVINSLVTSGFSGIMASDIFHSPVFLESFPRQL